MITVNNLRIRYARKLALAIENLTVPTGIAFIVGPNGAGKTTLFKSIVGQIRNHSADIVVTTGGEQQKISWQKRLNPAQERVAAQLFGYLPQRFSLIKNSTVLENVAYAAWARGVPLAQITDQAEAAVQRVHLSNRKNEKAKRLSGGMQQRLAIACASVHNPHVLILDEPTVGLDPSQQNLFYQTIRELSDRTTVLLSTHILADVQDHSDTVIVLNEGQATYCGTAQQLTEIGGADFRTGYERALTGQLGNSTPTEGVS